MKMAETAAKATAPKTDTKAEAPVEVESPTPEGSLPPGSRRRRVEKKRREGPFVKYVGAASERTITPADWKSLTIDPGKAPHTWNTKNDFLIEDGGFSDEQLDYLLIDDLQPAGGHSFLEVDYDSDGNLVQVTD
jgi:hypothetical protein